MEKEIEINGIKYASVADERIQKQGSGMYRLMAMAAMFGSVTSNSMKGPRPKIDLEKEFELIQLKQSKLSRDQRDYVVYQFNRKYKQI